MATATANTRTVTKTIKEEVTDGVVLTLTDQEAEALARVLGRIGGVPSGTRGQTQSVYDALYEAGVTYDVFASDRTLTGYLQFTDD